MNGSTHARRASSPEGSQAKAGLDARHSVLVASTYTLLALQSTKLMGVMGALALYWSRGSRADLFLLACVLLVAAVVAFRWLRARLIARLEQHLMLCGERVTAARARAARQVDGVVWSAGKLMRRG